MDRRMIHIDAALPQGGTYVGPNPNCPNLRPGGTNVTLAQTAEISRRGHSCRPWPKLPKSAAWEAWLCFRVRGHFDTPLNS